MCIRDRCGEAAHKILAKLETPWGQDWKPDGGQVAVDTKQGMTYLKPNAGSLYGIEYIGASLLLLLLLPLRMLVAGS